MAMMHISTKRAQLENVEANYYYFYFRFSKTFLKRGGSAGLGSGSGVGTFCSDGNRASGVLLLEIFVEFSGTDEFVESSH